MKVYRTSAPGFPVRGNGQPVPFHPDGDGTAARAAPTTTTPSPSGAEQKPVTTTASAPAPATAEKKADDTEKPTAKAEAPAKSAADELDEIRREREAFRKEAESYAALRARDLAAQRRATVRGFGLAVPMSDELLDKMLPADVDPSTTAGAAALAEFRKNNSTLFQASAPAPIADPTKVIEDILGKENMDRRIFGARAVASMLTDKPRSGWLD